MANGNTMPSSSFSMFWRWLLAVVVVLLLASAALVTSAYYTGWPKFADVFDKGQDTPPTLEVSDTALQGFMRGGSKGFSKFDDTEKERFKTKFGAESCPNDRSAVTIKGGLHYYTVVDEMTFGEVFASLEPVSGKQIFIAYYDAANNKYLGYPDQTRYKLVKDGAEILKIVAEDVKIPAYATLVIVSEVETKLCGKSVVTENYILEDNSDNELRIQTMISDMVTKNVSYPSGWVMMPFGMNKTLLAEMISALSDSLYSVWVWNGTAWEELIVTEYDANGVAVIDDSDMGTNNMVWFELKEELSMKTLVEAGEDGDEGEGEGEGEGEPIVAACDPVCVTGETCTSVKGAAAVCLDRAEYTAAGTRACTADEKVVFGTNVQTGVYNITCAPKDEGGDVTCEKDDEDCNNEGGNIVACDPACTSGNVCVSVDGAAAACVARTEVTSLCGDGKTPSGQTVDGVMNVTCVPASDVGGDVADGEACVKGDDCGRDSYCFTDGDGSICEAVDSLRCETGFTLKAGANEIYSCVADEVPPDVSACSNASHCDTGKYCVNLADGATCVALDDAKALAASCLREGKVWTESASDSYVLDCMSFAVPAVKSAAIADGILGVEFEGSVSIGEYVPAFSNTKISYCVKAKDSDVCTKDGGNFSVTGFNVDPMTGSLANFNIGAFDIPADGIIIKIESLSYTLDGITGPLVLRLTANNTAVVGGVPVVDPVVTDPVVTDQVSLVSASVETSTDPAGKKFTFVFNESVSVDLISCTVTLLNSAGTAKSVSGTLSSSTDGKELSFVYERSIAPGEYSVSKVALNYEINGTLSTVNVVPASTVSLVVQ